MYELECKTLILQFVIQFEQVPVVDNHRSFLLMVVALDTTWSAGPESLGDRVQSSLTVKANTGEVKPSLQSILYLLVVVFGV